MIATMRNLGAIAPCAFALALTAHAPARADPTPECNSGIEAGSTECGANSSAFELGTAVGQFSSVVSTAGTAIGYGSTSLGSSGVAVGFNSRGDGAAIAIGSYSVAGLSAVAVGQESSAINGATAIGSYSAANATNSVALGYDSIADRSNTVSVGTVTANRQIVNVAAGTQATDAVNLGQMGAAGTVLQSQITLNTAAIGSINTSMAGMQTDIDTLYDMRRRDRRDTRQGIASAIAMGHAPMPSQLGGFSYAVNGARFRGENAVGGSMMYRLNAGAAMAVGAGFSFAGHKNNGVRVGVAGEF